MAKLGSTQIYGDLQVDGEIKNKATTLTEGVVQLNDTVTNTSTTQAATANAVKMAYDIGNHSHPYAATTHTHTKSSITDFPTSMPASDVSAWAKASTKPAYTASEVGAAATSHNHTISNISDIGTGVCSTPAATPAKVLTVTNFSLTTNSFVIVKFNYGNTASNPTLNVSGTGAKPIFYNGAAVSSDFIAANDLIIVMYDGTNWVMAGELDYGTRTSVLASGGAGITGSSSKVAREDHTHTLPAYPTSLPANGGNADTVDNKHASDFAIARVLPEGTDLNTVIEPGLYSCVNPINGPNGDETVSLIVMRAVGTQYTVQYAYEYGEYLPYIRYLWGTTSSLGWSRMLTTYDMGDEHWSIATKDDIPTSLPANGGDADTLDGKHASYFAPGSSGIGVNSVTLNSNDNMAHGDFSAALGFESQAFGKYSFAQGYRNVSHTNGYKLDILDNISVSYTHNSINAINISFMAFDSEWYDALYTEGLMDVGRKANFYYESSYSQNNFLQFKVTNVECIDNGDGYYSYNIAFITEQSNVSSIIKNKPICMVWQSDVSYDKNCSFAEGTCTTALSGSHTEGAYTMGYGLNSHAEGYKTKASGDHSHAEGYRTNTYDFACHAEGIYTKALGTYSHAEGNVTQSCGYCSHAEGSSTIAYGEYSHAEGRSVVPGSNYIDFTKANPGQMLSTWRTYSTGSNCFSLAQGQASHVEGESCFASAHAHAGGYITEASGTYSHTEGYKTVASGSTSHAEGSQCIASYPYSHAEGNSTESSASYSHTQGEGTKTAASHSSAMGKYNKYASSSGPYSFSATNEAFIIGNGSSNTARSNAFRVTFDGKTYGLSAFNSTGADYAEYFEWEDGNPNDEDRVGLFVTLNEDKIRIAQDNDTYILGVISGNASIIGNSHEDSWNEMYMRDEFGRFVYEYVNVPAVYNTIPAITRRTINENDEIAVEVIEEERQECICEATTEKRIKLNPNYNDDLVYVSRSERKEWDTVGMLGQLIVKDDGTCKPNGYCKCGKSGIATYSEEGYRVIKRLSDHIIQVIIK